MRGVSNRPTPTQHEFATSNSTSQLFLGAPQRSWMTGGPYTTSERRRSSISRQARDQGSDAEPVIGQLESQPELVLIDDSSNVVDGEQEANGALATRIGVRAVANAVALPVSGSTFATSNPITTSGTTTASTPVVLSLQTSEDGLASIETARPQPSLQSPSLPVVPEDPTGLNAAKALFQRYSQQPTPPPASSPTIPSRSSSLHVPQSPKSRQAFNLNFFEPLKFSGIQPKPVMESPLTPAAPTPPQDRIMSPQETHIAAPALSDSTPQDPTPSLVRSTSTTSAIPGHSEGPTATTPVTETAPLHTDKRNAEPLTDIMNKRPRLDIHESEVQRGSASLTEHPMITNLHTVIARVTNQLNSTEISRIELLQQACKKKDTFYLALHQIYCLASMQPQAVKRLGCGAAEMAGLAAIQPILLPNERLTPLMIGIFANFPVPVNNLYAPVMEKEVEQVKSFLLLFPQQWEATRRNCLTRRFPPCCEEFVYYFNLHSSLMQRTLFNSLERQVTGPKPQQIQLAAENVFRATQERWELQMTAPGYSITKVLPGVIQAFEYEYRKFLNSVLQNHPTQQVGSLPIDSTPHINLYSPQGVAGQSPPIAGYMQNQPQYINPYYTGQNRQATISTLQSQQGPAVGPLPSQAQSSFSYTPPMQPPPRLNTMAGSNVSNTNSGRSSSLTTPSHGASGLFTSMPMPMPATTAASAPQRSVSATTSGSQNLSSPARPRGRPPLSHGPTSVDPLRRGPGRPRVSDQVLQVNPRRGPGRPRIQDQDAQTRWPDRDQTLERMVALSTRAPVGQAHAAMSGLGNIQGRYLQGVQGFVPADVPAPLIPPPGYVLPQQTAPNPDRTALHQALLMSPQFIKRNLDGEDIKLERLYCYVEDTVLSPQRVDYLNPFRSWSLTISVELFSVKAELIAPPSNVHVAGIRLLKPGCKLVRVKCSNRSASLETPETAEYAEMPVAWPANALLSLNDGDDVGMRKKGQPWKRDLATDLTDMVRQGDNVITMSYHAVTSEMKEAYYVAVEILRVADIGTIRGLVKTISHDESLASITAPLKAVHDEDVAFVDDSVSIDVIDPFMAKIWSTPTRGNRCKHKECFDLEAFLLSRPTRRSDGPTDPDRWLCPICSKDARPQSLVIDDFQVSVRAKLESDEKLDARAILVRKDGSWEAKMELEKNDDGIRTGMKSKSGSIQPEARSGAASRAASAAASAGGGMADAIEIDSD